LLALPDRLRMKPLQSAHNAQLEHTLMLLRLVVANVLLDYFHQMLVLQRALHALMDLLLQSLVPMNALCAVLDLRGDLKRPRLAQHALQESMQTVVSQNAKIANPESLGTPPA